MLSQDDEERIFRLKELKDIMAAFGILVICLFACVGIAATANFLTSICGV